MSRQRSGSTDSPPAGRPPRPVRAGRLLLKHNSFRAALVVVAIAAPATVFWGEVTPAVRSSADALVREGGLLWPLALLWLAGAVLFARLNPRSLRRRWRRWVAAMLFLAALAGGGSYLPLPGPGFARATLGGSAGSAVAGAQAGWAALRIGLLALAGVWLLDPRTTRATALAIGRGAWRAGVPAARWSYGALVQLARGTRSAGSRLVEVATSHRGTTPTTATPTPERTLETGDGTAPETTLEAPAPSHRPPEESGTGDHAAGTVATPAATREQPPHAPQHEFGEWTLPSLEPLSPGAGARVDEEENRERAQLIERTLAEYGIEVQVRQIKPGPAVTRFGLYPGWVRRPGSRGRGREAEGDEPEQRQRVKVDSILAREKDLALALAAPSLRIEAPVPGESVVGLEVPNANPRVVTLRSIMESEPFVRQARRSPLALALGEGPGGEEEVADLPSMPHLLVAGSTGSGKSVFLNSIIACLLCQSTPQDLRMLLIDPKRVELTPLNGLPHLVKPVVVEPEEVVRCLGGLLREMNRRYRRMEEFGVRNVQGFNAAVASPDRMPYVVVCIDELADLMMAAPHDVEHSICRLAQLGRATGIHLVVATQRPSVDVVTGLIKANFPCRASFNVVSQVDSRTILDSTGAERLLGRGDMLFLPPDAAKPRRVQGTFVTDDEIDALLRFWERQSGPPGPPVDLDSPPPPERREDGRTGRDDLFVKALRLASGQRQLSTSMLQRKLRIGYPRASRLKEELDAEGVLGTSGEVNRVVAEELLQRLGE